MSCRLTGPAGGQAVYCGLLQRFGITQVGIYVPGNGAFQLETHGIIIFQQANGSIAHAYGVLYRPVDIGRCGNTLLNEIDGLPEQGLGKAVYQQSRYATVQHYHLTVEGLQQSQRPVNGGLGRLFVTNHFHQRQHVHRLERVGDQQVLRLRRQTRQNLRIHGRGTGSHHGTRLRIFGNGLIHCLFLRRTLSNSLKNIGTACQGGGIVGDGQQG